MGKVRQIILLLAISLFAANAYAIYDWQPLQQNNLMSSVTNFGPLGQVKGDVGSFTYWPAPAMDINGDLIPPLMNYVYAWGLWVGGQVKTIRSIDSISLDTLVTIGYNPTNGSYEYAPGAVVGGVPQDPADASAKVYISTEADWPLKKTDGQDSILSMCDTRCVHNDYLTTAHATGGRPLKIEVTQTTYQWTVPQLQDIIYFLFEVKNTGTDTLYNVYLAPMTDCDIGNESGGLSNDVCYYDTTTDMAYQYQTSSTESDWSRAPGCVGYVFLQGPIATKDYTFPDARQIFAGDTLGLTHFKVFNIGIDPPSDIYQYQEMAGYDYLTGNYVPFDPKPIQGDQRFVESTGPIDIAPGQTAKVIVCLICANFDYAYMNIDDTLAIKELREKARLAKTIFENSIVQNNTQITLTAPVGGTVLSGTQTISWTYGGNALATDSVDLFYSTNGYTWDTLALNQPNTGNYSWNTANGPDGVCYKIAAVLHGPLKLASSITGTFVVNNAGNAAPEVVLVVPDSIISGNYNWRWMAGDADQDEIVASQYVMREGADIWQKVVDTLSSTPNNTQLWQEYNYIWNTDTMLNANYKLKTVCYDGQETATDSSVVYYQLYNSRIQYPGALTGHSSMPVTWYTYNSTLIDGHNYEARFKSIVRGVYNSSIYKYPAAYAYDLWDVSNPLLVSSDWVIYSTYTNAFYYDDNAGQPYSGFAVLCGDTTFKPSLGTFDSIIRPVTDPSTDTVYWASIPSPDMGWAKLNSNYQIRWHVTGTYPTDTLWPEVWDVTYNTQVPYDSTILNNVTTPSWNLGGISTTMGRRYIINVSSLYLKFINLCGFRIYFNNPAHTVTGINMTWATHPQEGDVWRIYSSGPIPPREGDVYSFTPTGVEGAPSEITSTSLHLHQNAPNPFKQLTTINYQLAKPGLVNLKVYNIAGQLVKTLVSGQVSAGLHTIKWDGRDNQGNKVSSGAYVYRLQAGNKDMTKKLVILK